MARMHSRKGGTSGSHRPDTKETPKWAEYKTDEVEKLIVKLRKQEMSQAMIGTVLRDQYGVPSVKALTGKTIAKVLKENNMASKLPEDLMSLIKRANKAYEHIKLNKKDKHSWRGMILIESKIKRISKYYVASKVLPAGWKYERAKLKILAQA
ncbi:MAG: 30S ribosomal protein S15 [Candidatus Aenigmarchaeota archaeon]|nr:30S ribosomal protein S15 [Candidatus Aenigmarchaeota archaeon]